MLLSRLVYWTQAQGKYGKITISMRTPRLSKWNIKSSFIMGIQELLIVAGPRAVGKSTFIREFQSKSLQNTPTNLSHFQSMKTPVLPLVSLKNVGNLSQRAYILHIDIVKPFDKCSPASKMELMQCISEYSFSLYPGLLNTLQSVNTIHVLTLHVSRERILQRWLDRTAQGNNRLCRLNVVRLYTDHHGNELFHHLYLRWEAFLNNFELASNYLVDVSNSDRAYAYSNLLDTTPPWRQDHSDAKCWIVAFTPIASAHRDPERFQ